MDIRRYLKALVTRDGSDLFFSAGTPPHMKVQGRTRPLERAPLPGADVRALVESVLTYEQLKSFQSELELNFALAIPGLGRFRVNVYQQRGELAMVIRHIRSRIPAIEELGLPSLLGALALERQGQIFITGATGSGKSTTLAAMIDHRNRHLTGHIVCIEDPIEFVHGHRLSVVDQREVGLDTRSYQDALENALRQAPDVIVVGEIRDRATMEHVHHFAETGHLCLTTLHANNAIQALERVLNFFPPDAHHQIRQNLAQDLRAVIAQRLISRRDGGLVPAVEVLLNTPRVSELIAAGELGALREAIAKGEGHGMVSFDQSLYTLIEKGAITDEEALRSADSRNDLELRIHMHRPGHPAPVSGAGAEADDRLVPASARQNLRRTSG